MKYATDDLRHEHEVILVLLEALEGAAKRMDKDKEVPRGDLEEMVDTIKVFADKCHHGKEEDLLFPALQKAGMPTEAGPIAVMLHDHEMGRMYVKGLSNALVDMKTSKAGNASFIENAKGYAQLLRNHIGKENNILFPMSEKMLPEAEQKRLLEEFAKLEKERIGEGVHEKLHKQVHDWHKKYAEV